MASWLGADMTDPTPYPRADAGLRMRVPTHRMTGTPEYRCWQAMIRRCHNMRAVEWPRYGGRGIRVCESWRGGFEKFYQDMGPRPGCGYSIDRIDNDGGYEPGNCRWATPREQASNRSNTRLIEFRGESLPVAEWARRFDVKYATLHGRLMRHGVTRSMEMSAPPSDDHVTVSIPGASL